MFVVGRHLVHRCTLGAKRSLVYGIIRVSLYVDNPAGFRVGVADQPTGDRTVIAQGIGLPRAFHLVDFTEFLLIGHHRKHVDSDWMLLL